MKKKLTLSLYQCALCTLKFPVDKIKYSKDGKKLICIDCHNKLMKKRDTDEARQKTETKQKVKQAEHESIKVMCVNCSYKFFYKPHLELMCPYCGSNKIRRYEKLTAQQLINESSMRDF